MTKKSNQEEEYFAREEKHRKEKKAIEDQQRAEEERKELHYMKCPKCGHDLEAKMHEEVEVDCCQHCNGIWLDAGELEILAGKENTLLQDFFSMFKSSES